MLKKSMDVLDINALVKILNESLKHSIIDNIYGARDYWILKLRGSVNKPLLKIEPGVRIHLSRVEPEKKLLDKFTLYLRSNIRGARITGITQQGWERIVEISLRTNKSYSLVAEIMPKGVLVLLDESRRILYGSRMVEMKDRVIKTGFQYTPPPGGVDKDTYFNTLRDRLMRGRDLARVIVKEWGLPGYVAEEIVYRSGLIERKNSDPTSLPQSDIDNLIDNYLELVNESSRGEAYLIAKNGEQQLYTCYNPLLFREYYRYEVSGPHPYVEVLDSYYTLLEKTRLVEEKKRIIEAETARLRKSIDDLKKQIEDYEERHREYWENYILLSRNYHSIAQALDCINNVRKTRGWEKVVETCKDVVKVEKDKGLAYVKVEERIIPLDVRLNASQNINMYMVKAGEYKSKSKKAMDTIRELEAKLSEREKTASLEVYDETSRLRPKYWFEKYHWLFTRNGLLAIGGRDADQNESIVKKYMKQTDIFIHADIQGAPVVVLKTEDREVDVGDIEDASVITVCYSRAWRAGFGFLEFYWVKGSQVSKSAPSGEYLGKGSFMIYGERKYGRCELKLGIGVEKVSDPLYGEYYRVIIGSEELVRRRSMLYALLVPGDRNVEETARIIYKFFVEKLGSSRAYLDFNEIVNKIPGPSRILNIDANN